jgi:hypothetical protein
VAVEEIRGALRVRGGLEDGALVLLEHLKPAREIASMVLTRLTLDAA